MLTQDVPTTSPLYSRALAMLESRSLPTQAAHWVLRALHPPAEHLGVQPVPDACTRPSVRLAYRESLTVSAPPLLATPSWDLLVVSSPGDFFGAVFLAGPAGTDFTASTAPVAFAKGAVVTSGGFHTALTGVVRTDVTVGGAPSTTNFLVGTNPSEYTAFRHVYKSVTAYMTASEMFDGGTVTAGTLSADVESHGGIWMNGGAVYRAAQVQRFMLPLTEEQITMRCTTSRVSAAKDGIYIPHKMCGFAYRDRQSSVLTPFIEATSGSPMTYLPVVYLGRPGSSAGVSVLPQYVDPDFLDGTGAYVSQVPVAMSLEGANPTNPCCGDTSYTDMEASVMIFRGLHPSASITLKVLMGLEVCPTPLSSLRPALQPPAAMCLEAIRVYNEMSAAMSAIHPSRDNAFGFLLKQIADLIPVVLPRVKRALAAGAAELFRSDETLSKKSPAPPKAAPKAQPASRKKKRKKQAAAS